MPSLESALASGSLRFALGGAQATAVGRPSDFLEGGLMLFQSQFWLCQKVTVHISLPRREVEVTSFDTSKHAHRLDLQAKKRSGRVGKASRENHKHFIDFKKK